MSCATSNSVSPSLVGQNSTILLETNDPEIEPVKIKIQDKAAILLNQLFNTDVANKNMVLVINNDSDCDFTMNILGNKSYTVSVAAKKTESIVVERGEYVMRSDVCKTPYLARKTLLENTQVSIKYSVVKSSENNTMAIIQ